MAGLKKGQKLGKWSPERLEAWKKKRWGNKEPQIPEIPTVPSAPTIVDIVEKTRDIVEEQGKI